MDSCSWRHLDEFRVSHGELEYASPFFHLEIVSQANIIAKTCRLGIFFLRKASSMVSVAHCFTSRLSV